MAAPRRQPDRSAVGAAALVDAIRLAPARRLELVALLAEQSPVYDGLGTREAERLRGYVLASFERVGLPEEALPFVLEELATGIDPYPVAAAARALRGAVRLPKAALALLAGAVSRIARNDDYVGFDSFAPGDAGGAAGTTALADILRSIAILGPAAAALGELLDGMAGHPHAYSREAAAALREARRALSAPPSAASCCCGSEPLPVAPLGVAAEPRQLDDLMLQDQSGAVFAFGEFFRARPSVVTFFYTRCMNPEKCSLTIGKLAQLQRLIRAEGLRDRVNLAAFTYDPAFDTPDRLHAYGHARGMAYDGRNKLICTCGPFAPVQHHFELGVGFGSATVNRHRIELLVLHRSLRIRDRFVRLQWREADVLARLKAALRA